MKEARNISIISKRLIFNYFVMVIILTNNLNVFAKVGKTKRGLAMEMRFEPICANTINSLFFDCGTIFQTKKEVKEYKNKAKI